MEWIYFSSFAAIFFIVFGTGLIIFAVIRRRRRQPLFSAPRGITTTTQQVPFTPGPQMQQTNFYPNQIPYPMSQQGYGMPMAAPNQQSYPMPQAPYPPGAHENMNPPSYDQVVGIATTTTTTNETYAKQAPYNPAYTG